METAVEDFLCPDGDMSPEEDTPVDTSLCQAGAVLGSGGLCSKSLASDSTAVRFQFPAHQPAQHALLQSPALSAAATPEVTHKSLCGRTGALRATDTTIESFMHTCMHASFHTYLSAASSCMPVTCIYCLQCPVSENAARNDALHGCCRVSTSCPSGRYASPAARRRQLRFSA